MTVSRVTKVLDKIWNKDYKQRTLFCYAESLHISYENRNKGNCVILKFNDENLAITASTDTEQTDRGEFCKMHNHLANKDEWMSAKKFEYDQLDDIKEYVDSRMNL